ncbi:FabD/lysophospholipase-like protein [Lophium mytilinum]|uniref:FabD/lysophospholipase-like protein n=1 Tax=Lophium mytilinum TaxID=390894 RepID=A0A6A6QW22_9PEZI|nr:FabD/lysophospholipase-like protein [Lophium mytilinum]
MSDEIPDEVAKYQKLPDLPTKNRSVKAGKYAIKKDGEEFVEAEDSTIKSQLWFRSPPLTKEIIQRLSSVQLFAESHDQGEADDESAGLWTWLELVLLKDEYTDTPINEGGIELAWCSHLNPLSEDYHWNNGKDFDVNSGLLRSLKENNTIGVRICARFQGWKLWAQKALLVLDIAEDSRESPPQYDKILARANVVQNALDEVNYNNGAPFMPKLAEQVMLQADALKSDNERPLRVLSLDGGGVKGFSTLLILQAVLDKAATGKQPFELFDLIGGTSTGGMIAIMLGRLKMSVADCLDRYKKLMSTVFVNKAPLFAMFQTTFFGQGYFYDAAPLETAIKETIKKENQDPEVLLNDPTNTDGCKVFVLAVRKEATNNRAPVFLRSYINPHPDKKAEIPEVKLWQAARATSAAPAYFPSTKVGNIDLVDGGLAANNPIGWLWTEVATVFTPGRSTDCFLSIGTGMPANSALSDPKFSVLHPKDSAKGLMAFGEGLVSAATNSESTNVLFRLLLDEFAPKTRQPKYFRLNFEEIDPDKSTKDLANFVNLAEMDDASEKAIKFMETKTKEWIKNNDTLITQAAQALKVSSADSA